MEKGVAQLARKSSFGDAAVSGLFGGLLGGSAMGGVIAIYSLIAGQGAAFLGYFSAGLPVPPLQGFFMHLGVSSIYGILYALLLHAIGARYIARVPGWLTGLFYALTLWLFAVTLLLPATNALILDLPWQVFFGGHIAYGLVLGGRRSPGRPHLYREERIQ